VLGQVIYTSELDPAYRPARPPVLLTCTDVPPEAGWAHSGHIRRGRDDAATCQPCLDSVLRPRRGLGCQPWLTGLGPGLERLSRAARARPLASGMSARMSMRLLTVADLPAHAEVLGRRAQGWQLACHSAHKHASAEASRRAGVAPLACGCTFMIVQKVVRKVEAGPL